MEIGVQEDKKIIVKDHFRTSRILKLREEAPSFTDNLLEIFLKEREYDSGLADREEVSEEEATDELERLQQLEATERVQEVTEEGFSFAMRLGFEELKAIHRFCVDLTESIEGFEDEDGDPLKWKHFDQEDKMTFYDCRVPQLTKVWIFINSYLQKSGMLDTEAVLEEEEDEASEDGDD